MILAECFDIFHFFLHTNVTLFNCKIHFIEVHQLQGSQSGLDEDIRWLYSQIDAGDALLHNVYGGHDGVDDIR